MQYSGNTFTFTCTVLTDLLEYLRNRLCREIDCTLPVHQDLRFAKVSKPLKHADLTDPRQGANSIPPIT